MCSFCGIDSVTQIKGLMPPETPLGSCASLQLPLQKGLDLPRQPEQTPRVAKNISSGTRHLSVDNWTSPHLYSDTYCAVLAQKASHNSVPWSSSDSSLLQTPTKKWVSPAEKKHFWGSYRFHAFPFPSPLLRKSKTQILSCPDCLSDSVRPWLPKWNTTFPFLFITQEEITSCMGHIRSVIGFTPLHHSY